MRSVNKIILHCSGTNIDSYDFDAICLDHVNNNGWSDIGYHFGIDYNSRIHILRGIERSGAHAKGYNKHSIGICVLGLNAFTKQQFQSLARLCDMLIKIFNIKKEAIYPHNEFNKYKTCPNFDVEWFKKEFM